MAQEIEPREYQDTPIEDLPEEMAEEALETQEEELSEHAIPKALQKIIDSKDILSDLSDEDVADIQQRVTDGYVLDWQTMEDYVDRYEEIIKLAPMD